MADQWYYENETTKRGPFSSEQLRRLAAEGNISFSDTIWKDGVLRGLVASKVKNLFPPRSDAMIEPPPSPDGEVSAAPVEVMAPPAEQPPSAAAPPPPAAKPRAKLRAIAGRGIVITSQDGMSVWFKRKCYVCGHDESARGKLMIKRGINRTSFLCSKCRKMREAEFQGVL